MIQKRTIKDNEYGKYLIDLKDHEGMILYYSLKERYAHMDRIKNMKDGFKVNLMKATQRVKCEHIIFKNTEPISGSGLIIDDSCFSGTTYRALKNIAPEYDYLAIFSK